MQLRSKQEIIFARRSAFKRILNALIWAGLTLFVFALCFGLAYGALQLMPAENVMLPINS